MLVPQAGIPCKKWEKSSQPSEYSRIPILHGASDLQAETEETSHKRKTNSSIKARRRNSLQKVTAHLPKVKSIPPALGSCVMLTPAYQCYRRNRDIKWSPGWQELSAACTADTAAVLREVNTPTHHMGQQTHISWYVLPTQLLKKREGAAAGVKGERFGKSKHCWSPGHSSYGQMPNDKLNVPLVTSRSCLPIHLLDFSV